MEYTIQKLASLAGVSTRTLHYYDEIGLLQPTRNNENKYRVYTEKELLLLQQILFFRELGFPLRKIKLIITSPSFDTLAALEDQRKWLTLQRERYEELIHTVDTTIQSLKGGDHMQDDTMFGGLSKKQMEEYQKEAEQRWGHTDAWEQSQERMKNWTKSDYDQIAKDQADLTERIATSYKKGFTVDSTEVQTLIHEHFEFLKRFYELSYEMYKNLAQMYVDDPRFSAYYDKYAKGLARFMRDGMHFYANKQMK